MNYQLDETPGSISEKQLNWILNLIDSRDLLASPKHFEAVNAMDAEEYARRLESLKQEATGLSKAAASKWIDSLKHLPKKAAQPRSNGSTAGPEPDAGMYRLGDGTIVRVYLGQKSGRMLAKKLCGYGSGDEGHWRYEYMGAASRFVSADTARLPLEEAKAFGRMTGTCCVCARRLDVPESVEAGIGPVCSGRLEIG